MITVSSIEHEIATLPRQLRAEVLDFVQFVKQRHGLSGIRVAASPAPDQTDSPFFQALTEAGFVGCVDTKEQLSTRYKSQLDFSTRAGVLP